MSILPQITEFFKRKEIYYDESVAIKIARIIEKNSNISSNEFEKKLSLIRTDFFRISNINRKKLATEILDFLANEKKQYRDLDLNSNTIEIGEKIIRKIEQEKEIITDIEALIDRFQIYFEQRIPFIEKEREIQDILDAYLNGAFRERIFSIKELGSGNRYIDIMLLFPKNDNFYKILIELKIYYSPSYYNRGIERLIQYMETEKLNKSFYIIADPRKIAKSYKEIKKYNNRKIYVYNIKKEKKKIN